MCEAYLRDRPRSKGPEGKETSVAGRGGAETQISERQVTGPELQCGGTGQPSEVFRQADSKVPDRVCSGRDVETDCEGDTTLVRVCA